MTLHHISPAVANNVSEEHVMLIQTAPTGILQKNAKSYLLTITKPDPWLTYFDQTLKAQPQLKSASFMPQKQYYQTMQQAFKTNNHHPFDAKIIAIKNNHDIIYYNAHIKNIIHTPNSKQVIYQLDLPNDDNDKAFLIPKTLLQHIVILINGDSICINCGGPW